MDDYRHNLTADAHNAIFKGSREMESARLVVWYETKVKV